MYTVKVIKSENEHEQAMARLMALMDANPPEGSSDANELELLAVLIEQFEAEHYPIDQPDPIDAICFRIEQMGLKSKDLVPFIGSPSKVSEVLNRKRPLSLNMIRQLSQGLGISADVLIREPVQQQVSGMEIDWLAFPLAQMRQRGYFPDFTGSLAELKEYAAEHINRFMAPINGFTLKPAMLRTTAHLRSNDKQTDSYAVWAWQAQVLRKAQAEPLTTPYRPGTVTAEWMRQLAQLSWSEQGPHLAKEYLNRAGIHLVFEPHLPKTYLDGAVCVGYNGAPVVALTLRYDRLDNFWFTLLHELAHIALHMDGNQTWYLDDLDAQGNDEIEQQADALAQESLIPASDWPAVALTTPATVTALAQTLSISPCIVAGRVRHETGDHTLFSRQFRDKVKTVLGMA
ncbi:ImmA/IrrE family metallo-endopeptidase [Aeromonas veronii]|uniref:ImmA/IrrE family metallo-endopeptidase n=1 Tax=Aeromonas veronii TaxID=654 RepID=UPI003D2289AE